MVNEGVQLSDIYCVFGQNIKTQKQQNTKINHNSRELNPGPLAPKADALPLQHRVN